jgi:hypothetical protein
LTARVTRASSDPTNPPARAASAPGFAAIRSPGPTIRPGAGRTQPPRSTTTGLGVSLRNAVLGRNSSSSEPPPLPPAPRTDGPAYRWYGYGGPAPAASPYNHVGAYPDVSNQWYLQTGATPGAFPVQPTASYRPVPGMLPPAAPTGPVPPRISAAPMPAAQGAAVSFDEALRAVSSDEPPTAPPVEPAVPIVQPPPETMPGKPVSQATPKAAPQGTVRADLVPPPPIPSVRWQSARTEGSPERSSEAPPPIPTALAGGAQEPGVIGSSRTTYAAAAPARDRIAVLLPPVPQPEAPAARPQAASPARTTLGAPTFVARAQSESTTERPTRPTAADQIRAILGDKATGLQVTTVGPNAIKVSFRVALGHDAEPLVDRICRIPELASVQVDFEVAVSNP